MENLRRKNSTILVIAIIGIVVLTVVGTKHAIDFFKKEKIKNTQADMLLVKAKIEVLKGNNGMNKDENPLEGHLLTEIPEGIDINEFKNKHVISEDEYGSYYILDKGNLEKLGLKELADKYNGYFIVNYDNFEVIYTEGYENENGVWCYKISDLKKKPESNSTQLDGMIENEVKHAEESANAEEGAQQ